jgi:acyl dehydratase
LAQDQRVAKLKPPFTVGQSAAVERTFTLEDVRAFRALNHDELAAGQGLTYAESTTFGRPSVDGMLAAGLFAGLIANRMPGRGRLLWAI